jgi:hypothetical protein
MRRLTAVLAVAAATAAAIPAAASAEPPVWAGEKPGTYGSCVAYEAMSSDAPVRDFIAATEPITVIGTSGEKVVGKMFPDPEQTTMGCVINFGP